MSIYHLRKAFVNTLGNLGVKFINALLLLCVLLSNLTGVVQARNNDRKASAVVEQKDPPVADDSYRSPTFERPVPRIGRVSDDNGELLARDSKSGKLQFNTYRTSLIQTTSCQASGDLVIANGETCSLAAGTYTFNSIIVQSGGTIVILGDSTSSQGVIINVANITLESGGLIDANTQGYAGATGPGKGGDGSAQNSRAGGGGHGGVGGIGGSGSVAAGTGLGGGTYGDLYAPISLGSGGGNQSGLPGGAGGGAIKLAVANNLTVNGTISANGGNGTTSNYGAGGGGAGGSIWIAAGSLGGNGQIGANGGNGAWTYYGYSGGGGGGRIAIDVPIAGNSFNGIVTTYGGSGYQAGGAGTVYWSQTDRLIVNNNAQNGAVTALLAADYDFNVFEIKSGGWVKVAGTASNITLTNNNTIIGDGTGRLDAEGTVHVPVDFVLNGVTLGILNGLGGASTITTQTNGGLELHANSSAHPNGIYSFQSITVKSGTFIRLVSYDDPASTNDYGVTLQVGDLVVESGGLLESDGRGYAAATGPGKGGDGSAQNSRAGGGGHGGVGGIGGSGSVAAGTGLGGGTYGDLYAPISLGSGGGNQSGLPGGAGGGAIKLAVANNLTVNGTISANGGNGTTSNYGAGGGGAGGSIWIAAGSLGGNGQIGANGGNGAWTYYGYSGGGGGGRIAIFTNSLAPTIQLFANGGSGCENGGSGTIYLDGLDPSLSSLTISPVSVVANGTSFAAITVTLKNADGYPVPNRAVEIAVASGNGLSISDLAVNLDQYVNIGNTDANGTVTATIKAITAGTRTIKARSGFTTGQN